MWLKVFRNVTFCLLLFMLAACGTLDAGVEPDGPSTSAPIPVAPTDGGQPTAVSEATPTPIATATTLAIAPTTTILPTAVSSNSQLTATPLPVRIQFASGAVSSTQTGTLPPHSSHEYILYALAGQTMHINLTTVNGKANFSLQGVSDGQPFKRVENEDRFWSSTLPLSQDYLIRVATPDSADSYTLEVTVDPLDSELERIEFALGATTATFTGDVEFNKVNRGYVLYALAGQMIHVSIASSNQCANFDLVGLTDGIPYKRHVVVGSAVDFVLPLSQDYLIQVIATCEGTYDYTLYVAVDPLVPQSTYERIQFPVGSTSIIALLSRHPPSLCYPSCSC